MNWTLGGNMKKLIAVSMLTAALIGMGGTAAYADTTDPTDTPVSTDTTDGAVFSETGEPQTIEDSPTTGSGWTSPVTYPGDTTNSQCEGGVTFYRANNATTTFTPATGKDSSVTGNSGVTLTISRSTSFAVTGTFSSTTGVTLQAGVAAVKQDYGWSVAVNKTGTSSSSGAWKVPSSYKIGRLSIGALKHRGTIQQYVQNRACKNVATGKSASYNMPENGWSFQHSKVS